MALLYFLGGYFPANGQGIPEMLYDAGGSALGRISNTVN
jgi:hypothetical protein